MLGSAIQLNCLLTYVHVKAKKNKNVGIFGIMNTLRYYDIQKIRPYQKLILLCNSATGILLNTRDLTM